MLCCVAHEDLVPRMDSFDGAISSSSSSSSSFVSEVTAVVLSCGDVLFSQLLSAHVDACHV